MDLRDVLSITWKRRLLVGAILLACVALAALFVARQDKEYESTATLALTASAQSQSLVSPDALSALLGTYAETAKSRLLLQKAAERLQRPLGGTIETDTVAGTGILRLIARAPSPDVAAADANAVADAFRASITQPGPSSQSIIVASIVDPALAEPNPVSPRPKLTLAAAAILGLFAGVVVALILEQLRRRITSAEDVSQITEAPVLGRLPNNRNLARRRSSVIWTRWGDEGLQEAYRALRTNLRFVHPQSTGMIQLTSPEAGAGKSTVSVNLAIAMAQIGVPTILVDADLRRPRVHEILNLDNDVGLSSFMRDESADVLRALQPTAHAELSVLTSGPPPADPTELFSIRAGSVFERLRGAGGLVIVDSPPILPVSDARLVAAHVDGVVMVVPAGVERPARLTLAVERLELTGTPLIGVVLNKARRASVAESGGYGYGGYVGAEPPAAATT